MWRGAALGLSLMMPVAAQAADLSPAVAGSPLPHELSALGMFLAADWVVKGVMLLLLAASIVTWTVWLAKGIEIAGAKRRGRAGLDTLKQSSDMTEAVRRVGQQPGPHAEMMRDAADELYRSAGLAGEGLRERLRLRLDRIEAGARRAAGKRIGILATIGGVAPFVGLFGTVWGIMNSFIGISKAQTTNLAVVAPGIAEALLATAIGLVAAIPAVIIYNFFTRSIAEYSALLGDTSTEVLLLAGRDFDRRALPFANAE
jgi:biopolymer transport protein ExbB